MIELEYFEKADFQQLINWIDSREFLLQWSGNTFKYPLTKEQLEKYIKDANYESSNKLVFKIRNKNTNKTIGHIAILNIDKNNRVARIGAVLIGDEEFRGKGFGQKAIKEVLKVVFKDLKLHKASLGVFDFNKSALKCYENIGFKKDGLIRDSLKNGNEYWNLWEMSILEEEWKQINKEG